MVDRISSINAGVFVNTAVNTSGLEKAMHGIIFAEIRRYIETVFGDDSWNSIGPDKVIITYSASRRICNVAKGIVKGIAAHFNEQIRLVESDCMLKGGTECKILVKAVS